MVDERDAEIAALKLRISGLEGELRKARARAYYAEGRSREAEETICPMGIGDPHRTCAMAEALADTLARACARHPDLPEWLEQTAEEEAG
jgi:hypothetical protein